MAVHAAIRVKIGRGDAIGGRGHAVSDGGCATGEDRGITRARAAAVLGVDVGGVAIRGVAQPAHTPRC